MSILYNSDVEEQRRFFYYVHVKIFIIFIQIGHLAEIADPDIARVLSWHMSSDIDCVVTKTTKSVREVSYVFICIFYL